MLSIGITLGYSSVKSVMWYEDETVSFSLSGLICRADLIDKVLCSDDGGGES